MNVTSELFVLCDYASISREQKLSVIGIFDQFFVTNLPTFWPKMFLVAVLKGEPQKEYPLTLKLIPPKGIDQQFPDRNLTLALGHNGKANLVTELVNFPLSAAGLYTVELLTNEEKISGLEFRVNKTTADYGGTNLSGKKAAN